MNIFKDFIKIINNKETSKMTRHCDFKSVSKAKYLQANVRIRLLDKLEKKKNWLMSNRVRICKAIKVGLPYPPDRNYLYLPGVKIYKLTSALEHC